MKAPRAF